MAGRARIERPIISLLRLARPVTFANAPVEGPVRAPSAPNSLDITEESAIITVKIWTHLDPALPAKNPPLLRLYSPRLSPSANAFVATIWELGERELHRQCRL
jgi:hypothetical protein